MTYEPPAPPPGQPPQGQPQGQQPLGQPMGQQPLGQQQGQQPQGQQPVYAPGHAPVQQAKRSNTWKIVLIVVGVVLALCCVGAIALGIWGYNAYKDTAAPASDAATSYLSDVRAGNYGSAYQRLCGSLKRELSPQEYTQRQSLLPKVTDYKVTGVSISNNNGEQSGTVNVNVTREMVGERSQTIQLVKEGGDWKVCQRGI